MEGEGMQIQQVKATWNHMLVAKGAIMDDRNRWFFLKDFKINMSNDQGSILMQLNMRIININW